MFTEVNKLSDFFLPLKKIAHNIKVLYVEDDDLIRHEYTNFLSRFFKNIECRENGLDGLNATLEKDFDLVISDIQMPKMSGLEMIEKIKEKNPNQATILISANKESDVLYKSIYLGVDGYMFKPLDRNQTIDLLYKVVSSIKMQYENKRYKEHLEELVDTKTKEAIQIYTIDKVTGLFSLAKLQQDIIENPHHSIALLKIRNFKNFNDFYGYELGNDILNQTAKLLKSLVELKMDSGLYDLYRVSGTHFAILTSENSLELKKIVDYIVKHYEQSDIKIENENFLLEMDAGILDSSCELSLSNADKALRLSEVERKVVHYNPQKSLKNNHKENIRCKDAIKKANYDGRIITYYQPIIDNKSLKIYKYEALVRMISQDGEVISPGRFLPISKETKIYHHITKTVIKTALNDFRNSMCSISINLSLDDINDISTRKFIHEQVLNFPEPSRIVFEILETDKINSYVDLQNFINEIKELGCKVAIDDFGSGYSNFEHLVKLKVDYIKIDGSLIKDISTDIASQAIVEMLSTFATKMGIKTIAEFVCSEDINSFVNSVGIDESQGYLFSHPIPFHESMNSF